MHGACDSTVAAAGRRISKLGDGSFWYVLIVLLPVVYGETALYAAVRMAIVGVVGVALYKYLKSRLVRERPYITLAGITAGTRALDRASQADEPGQVPRRTGVGRQADRAVLAELADRRRRFQIGQFTLAREIAGPGNMTLAVHIVRPVVEDICAIVVMRVRVEAPTPATSLPGLSPRESAVAQLICAGLGTKQIAVRLGISAHTARHHTERLFAKLGVHSRAGVVALCAGTLSIPSATKPSPNPEST